jgi:hypothetical protein
MVMKRMNGVSRRGSVVGLVGAGVLVAALGSGASAAAAEGIGAGRTASVPSAAASGPVTPRQLAQLERLAREVARPSGGTVTVTYRGVEEGGVSLLVQTARRGSFSVAAWLSEDADGVRTARENCRGDQQHPEDGRICTTLRSSSTLGVWSRDYSAQAGRQSLDLVATAKGKKSLWVEFDNYVETADGSKRVGPSWSGAGITVPGLRQAAVDSGLTVIKN